MIEVQILLAAAKDAFPLVSFPDFDFDDCWNQAIMRNIVMFVFRYVPGIVKNPKLELKASSSAFVFEPCINQFKKTNISPNSHFDLVVNFDLSGRSATFFVRRDRFPK